MTPPHAALTDEETEFLRGLYGYFYSHNFNVFTQKLSAIIDRLLTTGLPVAEGWRDIENAPKDGTRILLWPRTAQGRARLPYVDIGYWHIDVKGRGHWVFPNKYPTRWQPLPEPPKSPAQAGKGE